MVCSTECDAVMVPWKLDRHRVESADHTLVGGANLERRETSCLQEQAPNSICIDEKVP